MQMMYSLNETLAVYPQCTGGNTKRPGHKCHIRRGYTGLSDLVFIKHG